MLTKLYVKVTTALQSEEGATAVEYGIIVAVIAVAVAAAARVLAPAIVGAFTDAASEM